MTLYGEKCCIFFPMHGHLEDLEFATCSLQFSSCLTDNNQLIRYNVFISRIHHAVQHPLLQFTAMENRLDFKLIRCTVSSLNLSEIKQYEKSTVHSHFSPPTLWCQVYDCVCFKMSQQCSPINNLGALLFVKKKRKKISNNLRCVPRQMKMK